MLVFLCKSYETVKMTPLKLIELAKKKIYKWSARKIRDQNSKNKITINCAVPKYCKNQHDCIPKH